MASDAQVVALIKKQLIRRFQFDGATTRAALSGLTAGEWAAITNWLNAEDYESLGRALNERRKQYIDPIKQAEAEQFYVDRGLSHEEIEALFF